MQRRDFRRQLVFDAGVEVLFVFAHDHHVHVGMLGVDEGVVGDARPHVGVLAQRLAGGDVQALEAAALRRGDGGLEKDLGAQQRFPGTRFDAGGIAAQSKPFRQSRWSRCREPRRPPPESGAWRS